MKRLYGSGLALMGNMISCLTSFGDSNQLLQLTAGRYGFINVFWVAVGLGLLSVFQQTPTAIELCSLDGCESIQ